MYKKKLFKGLVTLMCGVLLLSSCNKNDKNTPKKYEETVVVANRGGASISFIDANSNQVTNTPISGSEPMYVVYVANKDKVYVGDRLGKKVHIINPQTKAIENAITVGNGVFHMWADGRGNQIWVNNDIDNTISVIDLNTNKVVQTINVGMKPHDVFLTKDATKAYVSVISSDASMPDKIFMYSTANYTKTGEVNVGKDPHLYHLPTSNKLVVPCQSGEVYILNGNDLSVIANNPFTGAHGIFASSDQNNIFVTNISGGQLYSINASSYSQNGTPLSTSVAIPHNIAINEAGNKIFVTHSGATATSVTTYSIHSSILTAGSTITAGTNPFGIAYYKREVK